MEEDELLTVTQVAKLLGVSGGQAGKWIVRGDFPNAYRLNPLSKQSHWRIPRSDVDAFIQKRRQAKGFIRLPVTVHEDPSEEPAEMMLVA